MKNFKKLIPALCLLLISAMLLGTSTFAWFSMNTTATAQGMTVKATSEGGLAIAAYTGTLASPSSPTSDAFKSTADAVVNASATSLSPTSTYDCETWYSALASEIDDYKANGDGYSEVAEGSLESYRLISKFQIKSLDEGTATDAADLYVSGVTVGIQGDATGDVRTNVLNKSLRVAIAYGDAVYFFAPVYVSTDAVAAADTANKTTLKCVEGGDTLETYPNTITIGTGARSSSIGTVTTTAEDVTIYIYYEGEDENCKSVNAIDINTLEVSVNFTTEEPTT